MTPELWQKRMPHSLLLSYTSACEKFQATRAKVAPVKLIYGSHFSGTKATYEVSQNIDFFLYIITIYLQEVDIIIGSPILC